MSVAKAVVHGLLGVTMVLLWTWPLAAAPITVRFAEGVTHGFLLLRTVDGKLIASGDLVQVARDVRDDQGIGAGIADHAASSRQEA